MEGIVLRDMAAEIPNGFAECRALDDPLLAGSSLFGLVRYGRWQRSSLWRSRGRLSKMETGCACGQAMILVASMDREISGYGCVYTGVSE